MTELDVFDFKYRWYINGKAIKCECSSRIDLGANIVVIDRFKNLKVDKPENYFFNFNEFDFNDEYRIIYMDKETDDVGYDLKARFISEKTIVNPDSPLVSVTTFIITEVLKD